MEALVPDRTGANHKVRPLLVVTPTADIRVRGRFVGVCITTKEQRDPGDVYLPVPSGPVAASASGLWKPSWVVCNWAFALTLNELRSVRGRVKGEALKNVVAAVAKLIGPPHDDE